MSCRTTTEAVLALGGWPDTMDIAGFMETASVLVDRVEAAGGASVTAVQLELIERWLSAHLISLTVDPLITMKQIDETKLAFSIDNKGTGLRTTPYGKQALALDTTWALEDAYGTQVHSFWIGDDDPDGPNPGS